VTNSRETSIAPGAEATVESPTSTQSISVVVPVFNGSATLPELVRRCHATLTGCSSAYELILVNDASRDRSWPVIEDLATSYSTVRGVDLARNYGQHNALLAGIREARHDIVVTIDDDLQNPPEEIPTLLAALTPDRDVVYGTPIAKRQGLYRRVATLVVVQTLRLFGGLTAPMVSSFRVFRADLRDGFSTYTSPDVSIDGLLTWATDRFGSVPVRHDPRTQGKSNYSLLKLIRHTLTMVTAFSTRPLRIASGLGFLAILFGIFVFAYVLIRFFLDGGSVPGFPFLASIISIFSGVQLFTIGVIGEYLARVHVRVMSKPSYMVRAVVGGVTDGAQTAASDNGHPPSKVEAPCELLTWDTEFWEFPVARVTKDRLSEDEASRVADWCDADAVRCAFLLAAADDDETAAAAEAVGFRPVDTRMTLERQGGPIEGDAYPVRIRPAKPDDREGVVALARRGHGDTRFFFDRGFPRQRAAELYERWIDRGFDEDDRQLIVAERDGEIAGYIVLVDGPPTIDLIAVTDPARGSGVGSALVDAAIRRYPASPLRVITQARNVQAMRLYEKAGFRVLKSEVWYHRWR
jgi:glycosyltransferase involved in cell wall biosynthesis/ribosomal protein S18 acetylase RimI-like enzyme